MLARQQRQNCEEHNPERSAAARRAVFAIAETGDRLLARNAAVCATEFALRIARGGRDGVLILWR